MSIGEEMLKFRAKENISQETAAKRAGITKQTWYTVENGIQTPSKLTETKIRIVMDETQGGEE